MVGGLHLNDVLIAHGACLVCCGYAIGLIVPPASLSLGATLWQIFPQEHFDFQFLTFETCLVHQLNVFVQILEFVGKKIQKTFSKYKYF